MTRPGNRPPSQAERRLAASLSGAVDLSGLKSRAEAAKEATRTPGGAAGPPAGAAPTVVDVDERSFEQEVLVRSDAVPVVVELGSARAPSQMAGDLAELARADGGKWVYARVDVDASPMIAQAFQVRAVPTVIAVAAGRPFAEFEGEQPRDSLEQWIAAVLRATEGKLSGAPEAAATEPGEQEEAVEPADPQRDAAEEALAAGDLATAEAGFAELHEQRPAEHSLLEALRYVQAARRVTEADGSEPESEQAEPEVVAALEEADRLLLEGEYSAAFARLVEAVRRTAGDGRTTVRTRLLELLDALPADDPQVLTARRDLAGALY